jgi:hypothetical protein
MIQLFWFSIWMLNLAGMVDARSPLTTEELQGSVITGTVSFTGKFKRAGTIYKADIIRHFTVRIGAGGAIAATAVREVHRDGSVTAMKRG